MKKKYINRFRLIAIAEGWSYLALLFIAMPLKYFAGIPEAVKMVGWAHGVLFIAYIFTLIIAAIHAEWKFLKIATAFVCSLIPFATFVLDKRLKQEIAAL